MIYTDLMQRKTTIQIDDALLAKARQVLGTRGLKDTVDKALTQVVRTGRRRDLANQLETGEGLDFDQETRRAARQWRT